MKAFVVFALLVAYTQATSEPITVQNRIKQSQLQCIQENGYDAAEIKDLSKNDILPTDNEKFNDFVFCYWKKVGVIDESGNFNILQLKVIVPHLIKDKYPNISEQEGSELADLAVDDCQGKVQAKSIGQSCVLLRNCVVQYVKDRKD